MVLLYSCNKEQEKGVFKVSKFFDRNAMLKAIEAELDDGSRTLEDIQTYTTNTDPWIIGTYRAAEALASFDNDDMLYTNTNLTGVFGAIEYVQDYETDLSGTVNTNPSDPEDLASMVAYINMDKVLNELYNDLDLDWNGEFCVNWDEELTDQQVEKIKTYINDQLE